MNQSMKNPHPFDMSNYLQGLTFVVGGKDFEKEEKTVEKKIIDQDNSYELDWSFLTKNLKGNRRPY